MTNDWRKIEAALEQIARSWQRSKMDRLAINGDLVVELSPEAPVIDLTQLAKDLEKELSYGQTHNSLLRSL